MIEFHDTGEGKGVFRLIIKTDVENENDFTNSFSDLLVKTINDVSGDDPELDPRSIDFPFLFRNYAEIFCKFRGYKANVIQRTITVSAGAFPGGRPMAQLNDKGQYTGNENKK